MIFHYFDGFLAEYESRFEKEYGFFRPTVKQATVRIVSIPLSEVEMLWLRGVDPLKTSLVALGLVGAVAGVIWGGLIILFLASGGID